MQLQLIRMFYRQKIQSIRKHNKLQRWCLGEASQGNTCTSVSFLIKRNFIKKETLAQMFSCEFWDIFKNTFFYGTPLVAASEIK